MGMFDYIKYKMPCPECETEISVFQSKDGPCVLADLEFWEVENFYAICGHCGSWVEFNLPKKRKPRPITDYAMIVVTNP